MREILIVGGGPAGAAAAIAARLEKSPVRLIERARTFRHKVCGEFISPEAAEILEALHAGDDFRALGPCRIGKCILHIGNRTKQWRFPEAAWGLSRLQLDRLLLEKAHALGAVLSRGESYDLRQASKAEGCVVCACGRKQKVRGGDRLFGFKTHFEGPSDDAVELFFDGHGYVGVSGIENGLTNVCGIARESTLRSYAFAFDEIARRSYSLAERLDPLQRKMPWLVTGPLSFDPPDNRDFAANVYPAGDSLGFVDPFSGSGILNALLTGRLAGMAAARRVSTSEYAQLCRGLLGRAFFVCSILRQFVGHTDVRWVAPYLPGEVLFRLTRASSVAISQAYVRLRSLQ